MTFTKKDATWPVDSLLKINCFGRICFIVLGEMAFAGEATNVPWYFFSLSGLLGDWKFLAKLAIPAKYEQNQITGPAIFM
jgi:hypothetical protein